MNQLNRTSPVPVAHAMLVVPQAHYRIFATRFQLEMYELFHQHFVSRALHMACTPVIVTGLLVLLRHVGLGPVNAAMLATALVMAYSVFVDRLAGAVTAPLVILAYAVAGVADARWGASAISAATAAVLAAGFVQTVSHVAEPIPPPLSGRYAFVPVGEWLRSTAIPQVLSTLARSIGFVWLEIWASPRIWVLQHLHLLMAAGYRPSLRADIDERMALIMEDSRRGWPGQQGLPEPSTLVPLPRGPSLALR